MPGTRRPKHRGALVCALAVSTVLLPAGARAQQDDIAVTKTVVEGGGCANGAAPATAVALGTIRSALVCLVNAERARTGLRPVAANPRLARSADGHSHDMVTRRYFGHVSPSGGTLSKRVTRSGYLRTARRWNIGETLAFGSGSVTPQQLFAALMSSSAHAAIIRDGRFKDVGVGLERGVPDTAEAGLTTTLEFGVVTARR